MVKHFLGGGVSSSSAGGTWTHDRNISKMLAVAHVKKH